MNNLDRYNEHILQNSTNPNSFISNVNYLARKFDSLMQVDEKFDVETVKLLTQLVKNSLDINIKILSEDLRKGSYYGYRKLDIDLLTNFKDYDYFMSDEEKNKLWNDPDKQVYYSSVDVWLSEDNTEILHKDFSNAVSNHHQLYQELVNWPELVKAYGYTYINISPDTPLLNHELLRITDDYTSNTALGTNAGSQIMRIALNVAQPVGYNPQLFGARNDVAVFTWVDTTSALLTIANKINDIIHAANVLNEVGENVGQQLEDGINTVLRLKVEAQDIVDSAAQNTQQVLSDTRQEMADTVKQAVDTFTDIKDDAVSDFANIHQTAVDSITTLGQNTTNIIETTSQDAVNELNETLQTATASLTKIKNDTVNETTTLVNTTKMYAEQVETAINKQITLTVDSTSVDSDVSPSVDYNVTDNKLTFSLPRSETAIVGLTNFELDTANGHLVLNLRDTDDILNAYVNESGNIMLEIKTGD